jgi:hypothetical protein
LNCCQAAVSKSLFHEPDSKGTVSAAYYRAPLLRPMASALLGISVAVISTALYSYQEGAVVIQSTDRAVLVAWVYLLVLFVSSGLVLYGLFRFSFDRASIVRRSGRVPVAPSSIIPYLLSEKRYRAYFVLATLTYGVLFSFLTGTVAYGDILPPAGSVPSSPLIAACCGPPLYLPTVTLYVTRSLGVFLVPLTVMLLVAISILVGLNFSLAAFALHNRAGAASRTWVAGLGAAVGLFTGCPTCAGLFFGGVLGGAGAVSFAALLSYYQPVFILLSVPVLVATPYLVSRSLAKVFREGCVMINPRGG